MNKLAFIIVVVVIGVGCADQRAAPAPRASTPSGRTVVGTTYGSAWPFSVPSGIITCESDFGSAVVLVADNVKYALNGRARGQLSQTGWRDSRDITLRDDAGNYRDVSPFIEMGLQVCARK